MIAVFAGPSLSPADRPDDPRFAWHPPAMAGDLLRLIERPPDALCLIDGYFDDRPAPWHKELLLLAARGTRLFGAASIGALRAAELDTLGMTGVGAIYRAYRDGRLTGDDEVALAHAPEPLGWAPLSVPLVEVRATLAAAMRARLIEPHAARALLDAAREIHFLDRRWELLDPELAALHVSLKRRDTLECLEAALASLERPPPSIPAPPWTSFMQELAAELGLPVQPSR